VKEEQSWVKTAKKYSRADSREAQRGRDSLGPGEYRRRNKLKKELSVTKWARLFFPPGCCSCMKQYSHKPELILYFVFIICYVHITEVTAYFSHLILSKNILFKFSRIF
jgi:hypothetical protein